MQSSTGGWLRRTLFAGAAALAVAAAPVAAEAAPYAYASNQITNLTVTYSDGSSIIAPGSGIDGTNLGQATTSIQAGAGLDGFAGSFTSAGGTVGSALEFPAGNPFAFAGPAANTPGNNVFTPLWDGTGTLGTRADANIGAGTAQTGVAVNNVAEGNASGSAPGTTGTSFANNAATITWTVVGTGQGLLIEFDNLIRLIADTTNSLGESASATITNTLQISQQGQQSPIFQNAPADVNRQVSSGPGQGRIEIGPTSYAVSINTADTGIILQPGVIYTVSLSSTARQDISVGQPVPEPATLALLGAGLLGLAAVRRRKAA